MGDPIEIKTEALDEREDENPDEIETKDSRKVRYAYKTCEKEAPRKAGFKKHKQTVQEKDKSTCNQRGREISLKSKVKTHAQLVHENYEIYCNQCDKELTLKDDPKELWNPGIYIEMNIAEDKLTLW